MSGRRVVNVGEFLLYFLEKSRFYFCFVFLNAVEVHIIVTCCQQVIVVFFLPSVKDI